MIKKKLKIQIFEHQSYQALLYFQNCYTLCLGYSKSCCTNIRYLENLNIFQLQKHGSTLVCHLLLTRRTQVHIPASDDLFSDLKGDINIKALDGGQKDVLEGPTLCL